MIGSHRLNAMLHSVLQLLDTAISRNHKIKTGSNKPISYRSNTRFFELLGYKTKIPHELIHTYGKTETAQ
jgi:hypothetical protein